ncbi:MFS transporter [Patulibacter brassicae]|uniref:MFS transporter n=1 Tax=Patulibacter brassicae TaxID=1705717 RepID=A0ABU4VP35_9ACTN|nr:MFS transporter [Patulibacter brassicae]MDX8153625.1 MFS transporter [Patulibacter brassicae]
MAALGGTTNRPGAGSVLASIARLVIAAGVALTLADASIVTLALPEILVRLDTDVSGVAAVIGVYTIVLAAAVLGAVPLRRRLGSGPLAAAGMTVFALACLACGVADTLPGLLAARAAQAIGAGVALVGAFGLLHRERPATRPDPLWVAAAVFGTAIGPPLGGALTELFDWRAIFLAQAPVAALAALACLARLDPSTPVGSRGERRSDDPAPTTRPAGPRDRAWPLPPERPGASTARPARHDAPTRVVPGEDPTAATRVRVPAAPTRDGEPVTVGDEAPAAVASTMDRWRVGVALALLAAALTAVLFLLVLLLVTGWAVSPLKAAVGVSLLPLAALAGVRIPGDPWLRACAGSGLVGAGVLALATLPTVGAAWVVLPQLLAGVGMGMALPAMAGELLPERTPREAGRLLALRHVGITVALLILAPVTAAQLDRTIDRTELQVVALVLDAKLPPQPKLEAVSPALGEVSIEDPRGALRGALDGQAARFASDPEQAATYAALTTRADETLVRAINEAFVPAFLITGALALLAALLVLPAPARHPTLAVLVVVLGLTVAGGQALMSRSARPPEVVIADPCPDRQLPSSGGVSGFVQDTALSGLDNAACRWGSSREELALAIGDPDRARAYERRYGHDPRDPISLLEGAITGGQGGFGDLVRNILGG